MYIEIPYLIISVIVTLLLGATGGGALMYNFGRRKGRSRKK